MSKLHIKTLTTSLSDCQIGLARRRLGAWAEQIDGARCAELEYMSRFRELFRGCNVP